MLSAPVTIAAAVPGVAGEQLIVGPDGHVYVFWETSIAASSCSISFSSSADAAMYTPAKTISGGAGACNSQPSAAVDSTGNIDVTWVADSTNVYFTRSTDGGANFSTPINIATPADPTRDKVIAGPDGGIYVLWTADWWHDFRQLAEFGRVVYNERDSPGRLIQWRPPDVRRRCLRQCNCFRRKRARRFHLSALERWWAHV